MTANGGHTTALTDDSASCKGFKAGKTLTVTGGTLTVDSADDALHASTDVTISGGTLTLATGDDAVHADNDLVIGTKGASSTSTPRINITASYEGLEGTTVTVYSGDIDVAASNDGVNAASSTLGERSDKYAINIAGGDLYIDGKRIERRGAEGSGYRHGIPELRPVSAYDRVREHGIRLKDQKGSEG